MYFISIKLKLIYNLNEFFFSLQLGLFQLVDTSTSGRFYKHVMFKHSYVV